MKTIPSNLSPRGWALLVLAGGSTLAIPFFKGSSSDGKYSTVSSSRANKPVEKTPPSPTIPKLDLPSPNKIIAQVLESSSEHSTVVGATPSQSPHNAIGKVEELPKPMVGNRADTSMVVSQPKPKAPSTAAPVTTEFPSWAKKPTLLDSLLNGRPSSPEQDILEARKPTSFQTWADNNPDGLMAIKPVDSTDRYTPFGQVDQIVSLTKTDTTAELRWPDEDPRTAVAIVQPPKLVGRDAMIRDPEQLQSPSTPRLPAVLSANVSSATALAGAGSGAGTGSASPGKEFGKAPATVTQPAMVTQPRFGEQPKTVDKLPRAALRSQLPLDEQQIIRQPSLRADR